MSDPRAAQAREAHRLARQTDALAGQHRATRDRLIRELRAEDPKRWTWPALAKAVGCTPELAAAIAKGRVGKSLDNPGILYPSVRYSPTSMEEP